MSVREQLFTLLRDLRWIIILSLFLSVVLFLPDQIYELYRIAADDPGWPVFKEFLAIALIAIAIWLGAFQLATEVQGPDARCHRSSGSLHKAASRSPGGAPDCRGNRGPVCFATR